MHLPRSFARRLAVFGLTATAFGVMVTSVAAGGPLDEVLAALGVIDDNVDSLVEAQAEQRAQLEALAESVEALAAQTDIIRIETHTNTKACAGIASACAPHEGEDPTEHWYEPAAAGNHNVVSVKFQVLRNGQPVEGLTLEDFDIRFRSGPANGPTPELCRDPGDKCGEIANTFSASTFGLYSVWVRPPYDPADPAEWAFGDYVFVVRVSDDDLDGYGWGVISIPAE